MFRLLFVGVLLTLACYPVLIVVASTIIFILIFTFWVWMPVILLVTYLFNILIKQFETPRINSYGCFARTFPLFRVVGVLIGAIGIIILAVLNLLLLSPIRTFFIMAYSLLTQTFRRSLDKIMMAIFTHLGRTPSRDTMVAKKISGPGMSK